MLVQRLSLTSAITKRFKKEINKINLEVNEIIKQNENVSTRLMSPTKAIKEGAMALFGL